jgi:hypothetical protein
MEPTDRTLIGLFSGGKVDEKLAHATSSGCSPKDWQ